MWVGPAFCLLSTAPAASLAPQALVMEGTYVQKYFLMYLSDTATKMDLVSQQVAVLLLVQCRSPLLRLHALPSFFLRSISLIICLLLSLHRLLLIILFVQDFLACFILRLRCIILVGDFPGCYADLLAELNFLSGLEIIFFFPCFLLGKAPLREWLL